jgi:putative tryptophan/tyrosine transport system substrate-binding protein
MRRRELLIVATAMVAAPGCLRAQQKTMSVIGFLGSASPGPFAPQVAAFCQGLSETGYLEGQNLAIEYRWAEDRYERLPALATDLAGRKVDVIVASGSINSTLAAKSATSTIRSSSPASATRSRPAWSPVSPGQAATSRVPPLSTSS